MNTQRIDLDVSKRAANQPTLTLRQGDKNGTTLAVGITDCGVAMELADYTVRLCMRLPDDEHYYSVDGVSSGNVASFLIDETYAAAYPGSTEEAYVEVLDGDEVICSTHHFGVTVKPGAREGMEPSEMHIAEIDAAVERANEAARQCEYLAHPITEAQIDSIVADTAVTSDNKMTATNLTYFWGKLKTWAAGMFAAITHTHTASQVTDLASSAATGVKGDAEQTYRTGDVNLTPANIGAAEASHTHTESDITDFGDYLPLSGGTLTGNIVINHTDPRIYLRDSDFESNVTSSGETDYIQFQDKNGTTMGRVNPWISSDVQYMRYITQRAISGETKYNILNLGVNASGNAVVSLGGTDAAAAWRGAIGALSTGGGVMTGSIYMRNTEIDRDAANPSSKQYGQKMVIYRDTNDENIGYIQPVRTTDGKIGMQISPVNEKSDGTAATGAFTILVDKSGNTSYEVNGPANFRSAIGLTTSTYSSLTNTGVTITAKSGFTVTVSSVRKYGNVVSVFGNIKSTSAWTAGQQINPFSTNLYCAVVSSDMLYGDATSAGNAWLRVAVATSANTARDFTMIGIL